MQRFKLFSPKFTKYKKSFGSVSFLKLSFFPNYLSRWKSASAGVGEPTVETPPDGGRDSRDGIGRRTRRRRRRHASPPRVRANVRVAACAVDAEEIVVNVVDVGGGKRDQDRQRRFWRIHATCTGTTTTLSVEFFTILIS